MNGTSRPRVAAWLLARAVPRKDRDLVLAELDEEYARAIRPERSLLAARAWYWRQAAGSAAWYVARRLRGGTNPRDQRGGLLSGVSVDIRHAWRSLLRAPAFSVMVVATLALGVGASTAVYSVLHAVVLAPLPYPDSPQLVRLWPDQTISKALMERVMARADSFETISGSYETSQSWTGGGDPVELPGLFVTPSHFHMLAVAPALGRLLTNADAASNDTVVISDELWQRRFGARSDVVGTQVTIGGVSRTIVGVLPDGHRPLSAGVDYWLPMEIDRDDYSDYEGVAQVNLAGRLTTGMTIEAAASDVRRLAQIFRDEFPDSYSEGWVAASAPQSLQQALVADVSAALWTTMGAVACLLLIACANVANLLTSRSLARGAEVAICSGLGASRWRIIRLHMVESLMLGILGGAVGLGLAVGLLRGASAWTAQLPVAGARVAADPGVAVIASVITLMTSLLAGLVPALAGSGRRSGALLRSAARDGSTSVPRRRIGRVVIATEVALAVVLVAGAGLMLRSVLALTAVDPGFSATDVTTMRIRFPETGVLSGEAGRARFLGDLVDRLRALPGVEAAGAVSFLPMATGTPSAIYRADGVDYPEGTPPPSANFQLVVGDYGASMGIPLHRGRWFTDSDTADTPVVGVINETLARDAFGEGNPIGRRITMFGGVEFEVVGIAGDTRQRLPSEPPAPEAFFAYRQLSFWPGMFLTVRSSGVAPSAADLRAAVWSLDPTLPVSDVRSMPEVVVAASRQPRLVSRLIGAFAVLAVLLGGVGIFGLVSHSVGGRRREFGLRLALGASRRQVRREAMAEAMTACVTGIAAGTLLALAASRWLESQLFGVAPDDLLTFSVVPVVMLVTALVAAWLPARRATTVDPATALRT